MNAPLRVGLAGAGWVTQHHLAGWARLGSRARVVAIADPDARAARTRADVIAIERKFASAEEMFDQVELDAVDVATPREFHAPIVRMAAARGLAVLCQKPLAPTLAQAHALVSDVADRCRLMVHENWRFRGYYRDAAAWLREGRIGDVVQGQMTLLSSGLVADDSGSLPLIVRQPFIATLERALVTEILIHHIDTLRYLVGDLELRYARLGHLSPAMRGEDRAFITLETQRRAPISIFANLSVRGEPPGLADRLTLIGTRGTLTLAGNRLQCIGDDPLESTYDMAACYADSYAAAIAHFVACLESGAPFETSPEDNLRTLALVEAAYEDGNSV